MAFPAQQLAVRVVKGGSFVGFLSLSVMIHVTVPRLLLTLNATVVTSLHEAHVFRNKLPAVVGHGSSCQRMT